jgi:hypothetical protein
MAVACYRSLLLARSLERAIGRGESDYVCASTVECTG